MCKLSIIIPVYNVEQFIEECLLSLYNQSVDLASYEVIVVNDGTQDNSMDIVNHLALNYYNLKIINQENKGLSIARNVGLQQARGEYVWFLDSDDWVESDSFTYILELIDKYDPEIISTPLKHFQELTGDVWQEYFLQNKVLLTGRDYLFGKLPFGASVRFIMKNEFLKKNDLKFHPRILHEDAEFGPRVLYLAHSVYVSERPIYNYRLRVAGSIMTSWKPKNSEDLIFIHKHLSEFVEKISSSSEQGKFRAIIFEILLASVIFAKHNWGTKAYSDFYNANKKYIKSESLKLMLSYKSGIKSVIKGFLTFLSTGMAAKLIPKLRK